MTANATQQTLQKLLGCPAREQGSTELQDRGAGVGEQLASLRAQERHPEPPVAEED